MNGTTGVVIQNMVIDGSGNLTYEHDGCALDFEGVLVQNATVTMRSSVVRNEAQQPLQGCQVGGGIFAQGSATTMTVTNVTVTNYQKNGITAHDPGTSLAVTTSTVVGVGETPTIAQNGIEIAFGVTGSVKTSTVADDVYTGGDYASSGILVYEAGDGVVVSNDTVVATQLPIEIEGDGLGSGSGSQGATVTNNSVLATRTYDAIDICGATGATVGGNSIKGADESGVHVDGLCGVASATVYSNTVNGSCAGLLVGANSSFSERMPDSYLNDAFNELIGSDTCPATAGQARHGRRVLVRR